MTNVGKGSLINMNIVLLNTSNLRSKFWIEASFTYRLWLFHSLIRLLYVKYILISSIGSPFVLQQEINFFNYNVKNYMGEVT